MATRRRNVNTTPSDGEDKRAPGEKKMQLEEKLEYIDREIRKLRVFCVNAGYSSAQIERFAEPFLKDKTRSSRKLWAKSGLRVLAFLIAVFALFYIDPAERLILALGRRSQIAMLNVWDWTKLYELECFIENPFFQEESITQADCQICEGLTEVKHVQNMSITEFMETYLKRDTPVLVEDGIVDWLDSDKFTLEYLGKMFNEHPVLSQFNACTMSSNIKSKFGNHRPVLAQAAAGKISNFFLQWENCFHKAAKVVRQMYHRPYFLPPNLELSLSNTMYVSSNYTGKLNKEVQVEQPMIMVMQLRGEVDVILEPHKPCDTVCPSLKSRLKAGQVLVATSFLWNVSYNPNGEGINVGIVLGGIFD